ncbi:MAG: SIMPL domain-containing protein [Pyrinomonadaceae bacterium]|nr:SIMPL domain-containing protein [Pyrinomonadaceae bacterium]
MKKLSMLFVLFAAATGAFAQSVDTSKLPTVDVTGVAEIFVVPDEVTFSLKVAKTDRELEKAKRDNDQVIRKVLELAREFKLDPKDVKTDFITVKEAYERQRVAGSDDEYRNVFVGYTVSKTAVVKLKDLSRFEEFFSKLIGIGVTDISGVTFASSQLRKHKDEARAMAMRAAREKATALATVIGQSVGKAVSIKEENVDGYRSPYANVSSNSFAVDGSGSDDEDTFSVGTISVKAQVQVSFLLN